MSEPVLTELNGGVLTVTLNRPEKKNAITQGMYAALAEATNRARTDDAVRVLLFRATGDSFSAGNDIADFIAIGSSGGGQVVDAPVFPFLKALADLDKPAMAAVRGRAVGIGLTLLLHSLAPEAASSLLLPMVLGHQRAFEIFALGEPIDGRTAQAWGLANRAVPADQVDALAAELAAKVAARAPNSIRKTKRLMRDAERLWALMQEEGKAFGSQMSSPEAMEAFMAFTQKRAPVFG